MAMSLLIRKVRFWLSKRKTGQVKFFNHSKGYGFIQSGQIRKDIFVHVTNIKKRISRGDKVVFRLTRTQKGLEATDVRPLEV